MKKIIFIALIFSTGLAFSNQQSELNADTISVSNTCINHIAKKSSETSGSEFKAGWEYGHCRGWKSVKGQYAYCPYPPYPPYPPYGKDTYQDGYDMGYRRGVADASK